MARKWLLAAFVVSAFLMPARVQAGGSACANCYKDAVNKTVQCYSLVLGIVKQALTCSQQQPNTQEACYQGSLLNGAVPQAEACGGNVKSFAKACVGACVPVPVPPKPDNLPCCSYCVGGARPFFPDKAGQGAYNQKVKECGNKVQADLAAHRCKEDFNKCPPPP